MRGNAKEALIVWILYLVLIFRAKKVLRMVIKMDIPTPIHMYSYYHSVVV